MQLKHVPGKNKGTLVLYALSTCIWCKKMKKLLNELGLDYSYVDVDLLDQDEEKETLLVIKKFNPRLSFPTLVINDEQAITGYDEEKVKGLVKP